MRIAFISSILNHPLGGADTLWVHAAEAAMGRGDQVLIAVAPLVSPHRRISALVASGAQLTVRTLPNFSFAYRMRSKLQRLLAQDEPLVESLRGFRPDLVVFSGGGTNDLLAEGAVCRWLESSRTPFRFIANWQAEHPIQSTESIDLLARIFTAADALFFVSTRNLEVTRRHLVQPLGQAIVLQNPLTGGPAEPIAWPAEDCWSLAIVGRLDAVKGLDVFLHAVARALGHQPDWRVNIYGRGPQLDYLQRIAHTLNLTERVRFRGYESDLRAIWLENHLLVSPAIDEGVPMTIPEAMLRARPVLATDVGGAADWITHDDNGFICPAPTLGLLTASLAQAWERRHAWREFGERARVAAAARYRHDDCLQIIRPVVSR